MQCEELGSVLEREGLGPLPADAQQHLAGCVACQDLLADFSAITVAAKSLDAEVAPPDRVWISLRAQLEAEGVIKVAAAQPDAEPSFWDHLSTLFRPRSLATVGAGFLLLVTAVVISRNGVSTQTSSPTIAVKPAGFPAVTPPTPEELGPSPSERAATTLQQVESEVPNMQLAGNSAVDTSLRQNLRTLNEFIAECEQHLKKNPDDELAREYLNAAYQQKAELLAAMMESGRSEH
jgi:hypothetical protein